ncbi:hypothetical protein ACEWY4_027929 [Coilia grayii]|uniref:DUF6729 domain-containing protein n=1 Tax=Coilia grayii TaxID=363190 RepID=A0ABD1IQI1_9TELE
MTGCGLTPPNFLVWWEGASPRQTPSFATGSSSGDQYTWYSMLTEVLACNACRKAAKESDERAIGRYLSWEAAILNQLSPAHKAVFPAVLTLRRGVDNAVSRLMRDRTEGNTMAKVWRQIQESHCEEYLPRKDLYTTLLCQYNQPGKDTRILSGQFQRPPPRRKLQTHQLLRSFLVSEAENIEDYTTQIMSIFGKVLKYDSTKKICKKLSGEGKGTAEWCTNVANEQGQILMSVLTCEESLDKMRTMADGLMAREQQPGGLPLFFAQYDSGPPLRCCLKLDLHDHSIQQFDSLYSARWGNALFGRTSGDPAEASLMQKLKFGKRYSTAHLLDARKNRLMYCTIKQLWLHPDCGGKARGSSLKHQITTMYQRMQQRVTVDDPELSKLGIPILKINTKSVSEFIRRQEALSATNVTDQGLGATWSTLLTAHRPMGQDKQGLEIV